MDSKAQKTDGYQLSKAVLLNEQAEFNAKPELEIYADDVKCSHGSASGNLDDDSIFYLMSRGLDQKTAKELLISTPFITEKLNIAVPNYFLGRWLWEQITINNQISALYELKTISNYTESLLTNFFPEIDMGLWNFESIKWGIID